MEEDWIGVKEAAGLVPSPRPGKKTHLSTLIRWCVKGKLEYRRRGRWWFVKRADVLALLVETKCAGGAGAPATPKLSRRHQRSNGREWAKRVLDAAGIG